MKGSSIAVGMRWLALALFCPVLGCGGDGAPGSRASSSGGKGGSSGATLGGSGGSLPSSGGSNTSGTGGVSPGGGSSGGGMGGTGSTVIHGGPGCGLDEAAFCDTFDAPAASQGRAGELDSVSWGAGRLAPQLPSGNGVAYGIGPGTIPACRAGLATEVYPDDDAVICDPSDTIKSNHLLVATAAQNYGQDSFRIRQPFDFAGRTGKIVFDAEGYIENPLIGWISVEVTEDPINAPCFSVGAPGTNNDEGSLVPRNAFEVQFQNNCAGWATPPAFSMRFVEVLEDYVSTELSPATPVCKVPAQGKLNHFEIDVSQTKIDVYATDASNDGVTFGELTLLYSAAVNLPFSRGYVQITTHNHATLKYSSDHMMEAWIARWDNVGFDGPIISNTREYEAPDALKPGMDSWNRSGPVVSIGYRVPDAATGPTDVLTFKGLNLEGVTQAQLSVSSWYLTQDTDLSAVTLSYRFNGGAWNDRKLTAGEIANLTNGHSQGQLGQMLDVPVSDLVAGDNTVEFVTSNVPQSYPPLVANVDLILITN
ncbi:MAG TPA: hypothetical protein VGP93_10985 [Polyangiaceae bacterium]|nr:hypothetical protein [Polyangiaceae bacterium]